MDRWHVVTDTTEWAPDHGHESWRELAEHALTHDDLPKEET